MKIKAVRYGLIRLTFIIPTLLGSLGSPAIFADDEPRQILVGTWDNQPLVFRDPSGKISGLAIDILEEVARRENWQLSYSHGSWANKYDELQKSQIDLLTIIAYTPQRDTFLDYPKQTLINNWAVVYQTQDNHFTSMEDLRGKRIALVTKVIHSKVFTELMDKFNFPFEVVAAKDFEEVLQLVDDGKADAGVINRVISIMRADKYKVKPTGIIFNPVQVRLAVPEGINKDVIDAIDRYLVEAKENPNSHYYKSLNKWLKNEAQKPDYSWVIPVVSIAVVVILLIAAYIQLVRREVKRRTADLAESEARFRQMADNINSIFWIVSADWNEIIYASSAYEKIWGKSINSLYRNPKSWIDSVHPDDREQLIQNITATATTDSRSPEFHEYRMTNADGKELWISTHAHPVLNEEGKIYRYAGIAEDITARKLAEIALSLSKREIETVLNSISDVIIYSNRERNIILTNPAMEKSFGYQASEVIGKNTSMIYENIDDFKKQGNRQFGISTNINNATYEVNYKRKDGSIFVGETFGSKVFDGEGNIIGFIGVIRDVTQRKQVESELLEYRDHLEELVNERTIELSNLNRELEAFSYSVSHDLRAPLRAINGFSSILYEDNIEILDDNSKKYLNRIIKASVKMEQLIDDLLLISRVSRLDLNKETVDVSKLCEDIAKTLQRNNPERQASWDIEKELTVKGDQTLVNVLIQNLLDNAWKYSAKSETAEIRVYRQRGNGSAGAICVEDNGTGFDINYKDKIFKPFQRLHSDKEFEGTGIGLATVNRVIHRHGGKIWAESEVGKGSKFYFHL